MRLFFLVLFLNSFFLFSQEDYSRRDSLRGNLTSLRDCYDVFFYDLFVMVDEENLSLENSYNNIYFTANIDLQVIQIDLIDNMQIEKIIFESKNLEFKREFSAVYIYFPRNIKERERVSIKIFYRGVPQKAINPPWDGGFSWENDSNGNPLIGVSCQGIGASTWWPCKDHQSDEPDSMRITCVVRAPWKIISNGNLRNDTVEWNSYFNSWVNKSEWFVSYPINSYNVSLYIGDYVSFSDQYISALDTLDLDYYVLSYNLEKAKKHFEQVKPMMNCFEKYFGKYPFWEDGYSLVETSYLGMEHQSAIAYGNNFLPGYNGNTSYIDNLSFDFIIVHESGHEWWGNSITTNDIADMWVHEGFCTYAEVLYVECVYGYNSMLSYVNNQKRSVLNDKPVIGPYHVNVTGSNDMYYKGSLMLHTIRSIVNNDSIWFNIIKGIATDFKYNNVDGNDIINYINFKTEKDLSLVFKQYLESKDIPELQYKIEKHGMSYTLLFRWNAIDGFDMPLLINKGADDFWIYPDNKWKEIEIGSFDIYDFNIREDLFFINSKKF